MSIRIWHVIMYPRHTDDYNIMMSTNHTFWKMVLLLLLSRR